MGPPLGLNVDTALGAAGVSHYYLVCSPDPSTWISSSHGTHLPIAQERDSPGNQEWISPSCSTLCAPVHAALAAEGLLVVRVCGAGPPVEVHLEHIQSHVRNMCWR